MVSVDVKHHVYLLNVPRFCSLMKITSKSKNVKFARFISCICGYFDQTNGRNTVQREREKSLLDDDDELMLNVLRCHLTY